MSEQVTITKKAIYTAIWEAKQVSAPSRVIDLLRAFIKPAPKAPQSSVGALRIAWVVGHNSKATGAYAKAPVKMSEYGFNSVVGDDLVNYAESDPTIEVKVFKRKPISSYNGQMTECYRRVNKWKPDIVIEAHFNWLNGEGRIEMISHPNSTKGKIICDIAGDEWFKALGSNFDYKHVTRGSNDRGGLGLALANAPACLTEPFDCSNQDHLKIIAEMGTDGVSKTYYKIFQRLTKHDSFI